MTLPPPEHKKDRLFSEMDSISDFKFDEKTVNVFDDMVGRCVPYYMEMQRMISEMAADFVMPDTQLYDLGCATGTTMAILDHTVDPGVSFIGIDNSPEMLEKARKKIDAMNLKRKMMFIESDIHEMPELDNASMAVMFLTLQFVRPLHREQVIQKISRGLQKRGCLILVEKLTQHDSQINRLFIEYYYEMKKRNGYSDNEISHKREALENILIPYRLDENVKLLKQSGFRSVEVFFRWYNFCGILALK